MNIDKTITIKQAPSFKRSCKKLRPRERVLVDDAICAVIENLRLGKAKVGDLAGIRVYKFNMNQQLTLLAYTFTDHTLTLLTLGSRENFYRDLKQPS